jgi:hypothetical protein
MKKAKKKVTKVKTKSVELISKAKKKNHKNESAYESCLAGCSCTGKSCTGSKSLCNCA